MMNETNNLVSIDDIPIIYRDTFKIFKNGKGSDDIIFRNLTKKELENIHQEILRVNEIESGEKVRIINKKPLIEMNRDDIESEMSNQYHQGVKDGINLLKSIVERHL